MEKRMTNSNSQKGGLIIDHTHTIYMQRWHMSGHNRWNGAFYYSKEIVNNIIPAVKTDRGWMTVNVNGHAEDGMIIFIHNNLHPERYDWLKAYDDLILVCGIPETCEKVAHLGTAIYLPLSIDVEYVRQFRLPKEKRHGAAFVGRRSKRLMEGVKIPEDVDILEGFRREALLPQMAKYEFVYAVGRTAIEARALGCRLKAYDPRFPKVSRWKVIDNGEAALMLQEKLDEIDGGQRE